jgi:hypothetical protein
VNSAITIVNAVAGLPPLERGVRKRFAQPAGRV